MFTTFVYIIFRFNHLLNSWNQDRLQPDNLALYCNVVHQKGAPLQNCLEFAVGTVLRIYLPKINQNIVYNGHKRVHDIISKSGFTKWTHL